MLQRAAGSNPMSILTLFNDYYEYDIYAKGDFTGKLDTSMFNYYCHQDMLANLFLKQRN